MTDCSGMTHTVDSFKSAELVKLNGVCRFKGRNTVYSYLLICSKEQTASESSSDLGFLLLC